MWAESSLFWNILRMQGYASYRKYARQQEFLRKQGRRIICLQINRLRYAVEDLGKIAGRAVS